jgi:alternative ribosome-rescue factor
LRNAYDAPDLNPCIEGTAMAKPRKRPNKAKSLIAQPLFRNRQEQPKKGKGSYRREASQQNWGASVFLAA